MPRFSGSFGRLTRSWTESDIDTWIVRQPRASVKYLGITDVSAPPANDAVPPGMFYRVLRNEQPKWALFRCPCGCGFMITLSLQQAHHPHWLVRRSGERRPTLRPSVWRDAGCFSHFFVDDGRVYWCVDTGLPPWKRD
jgi:hypothetical protein